MIYIKKPVEIETWKFTSYDRTNIEYFNGNSGEYKNSTPDLVRNAFRNDNYMNIFGRD